MRRTRWFALGVVLTLALASSPVAGASGGEDRSRQARGRVAVAAAPVLADADDDGIADGLEARLASVRSDDPVDVIVLLSRPGRAEHVRNAVGQFAVRQQFSIIPAFAATVAPAQVRAIAAHPAVARVEEDFTVTATLDGARNDFGITQARQDFAVSGAGAEVCVLDTGVDPAHEQLDSKSIAFFDAIGGRASPYDDHGHGTHVAAIAVGDGEGGGNAARYAGVAPEASLSAAKVLDAAGSGTATQIINGIEWCVGRGSVDILSMSLGTASSSDGKDSISQAVNAAVDKGKVAVVAAGNSGDTPQSVGSPGAAANAVTVGAVAGWSSQGGLYLAQFSSRGPTADGRTKPDVSAPGVGITAAQAGSRTGYVAYSGTSMATPFVSGTAALMIAAEMTPSAVKAAVTSTAEDRGVAGQDNDWGYGVLDGYGAVATAKGASASGAFPTAQTITASVADGSVSTHEIAVTDTSLPLAVTMLIDGELNCTLFALICWSYEWTPDLELRLRAPNGTQVGISECPAYGTCAGVGHQETITVQPTVTGPYTLEVWPFEGTPNDGRGGAYTLDVSNGPLVQTPGEGGGGEDPPQGDPGDVPPEFPTTGETSVLGVVKGDHVATHEDDDVSEEITEDVTGGNKKRPGASGLEHHWRFDVEQDGSWALAVDAGATGFGTGEQVRLEQLVGRKWVVLGDVGDARSPYPLTRYSSGPLTIRVIDSDRTTGAEPTGTVAVDKLAIVPAS